MKAVNCFRILIIWVLVCLIQAPAVSAQDTRTPDEKPVEAKSEKMREPDEVVSLTTRKSDDTTNDERYRIGYQDTLEVQVFRHPELSGTVNVNPNGTIFLPRLDQPIIAVCKTERELADAIAASYRQNYLRDPFVNVRAVDQRSQAFAVIGAVEKPGSFYVNRRIRLLELLAFAGGPTDKAGMRVLIARTGSFSVCKTNDAALAEDDASIELIDFQLRDVMEAKSNLWMKPGDVVSVLEAEVVYVVGNVNEPQTIKLKEPITLTQAIAAAQGLKPATKKDNVRILRQKAGSPEREELVFDLKEIENRKTQDPVLQANDIVAVSEDKTKSIINGLVKALTGGASNIPYIIR